MWLQGSALCTMQSTCQLTASCREQGMHGRLRLLHLQLRTRSAKSPRQAVRACCAASLCCNMLPLMLFLDGARCRHCTSAGIPQSSRVCIHASHRLQSSLTDSPACTGLHHCPMLTAGVPAAGVPGRCCAGPVDDHLLLPHTQVSCDPPACG